MLRASVPALLLCLAIASSARAAAAGETHDLPSPESSGSEDGAPAWELQLGAYAGVFQEPRDPGFVVGVLPLVRHAHFAAGALVEAGQNLYRHSYRSYAGAFGATFAPDPFRIDALGVAGLHDYTFSVAIQPDHYSRSPGLTATAPFVGARLAAAYQIGSPVGFVVGLVAGYDHDLEESTVDWQTPEFGETRTYWIDVSRTTLALQVGGTFAL